MLTKWGRIESVMTEIEFAALLVSRVCHDLVGPLGAVVNGMEVLEDERDPAMRADAIKLVTMSADQALARIQFMRIAFGAAGSAGAELDLGEIGRLVTGLLEGGKVQLAWNVPKLYWGKDWAKLLMNATLLAADCLPRGGMVTVETGAGSAGAVLSHPGRGSQCPGHRGGGSRRQGRGAECGRPPRPAFPDPQAVAHGRCHCLTPSMPRGRRSSRSSAG